jgi:protoheme IX farnesyltransferase
MSVIRTETAVRGAVAERSSVYVELTKPRITAMVLLTVAMGYFLAAGARSDVWLALHVLIGAGLACSGSGALNQYLERETDGRMDRTRFRPLPSHKISPVGVLLLGTALVLAGVGHVAWKVNALAAALNALTVATYLFVYTPMKRTSSLSTVAGAVPGALPPVIGWAAATGSVSAGGWILFAILFLWQIPHFLAIGRMYRDDYAAGGFPLLAVVDAHGHATGRQMVLYSATLVPVSLLLTVQGLTGSIYFWCALALGIFYAGAAFRAARDNAVPSARGLLLASVLYLPILFSVICLDRVIG